MFSDHNRIELKVINRKIRGKSSNTWKLSHALLNNAWLTEEVSREIKKYIKMNENENTTNQKLGT